MEPLVSYVELPQARMACYQWGDDAKRTVLCVHGLTRNGRDFDPLASDLASDFRVLSPDMPGRGLSEWLKDPQGYNYPNYVKIIGDFIAAKGLSDIIWVGTSMGGIMGMMAANAFPGLIKSLVLNDIGTVVAGAGIKRIMSYPPLNSCPTREQAEATLRERCAPFGIREETHWQHLLKHGVQERNGCYFASYDPAIMAAYANDRKEDEAVADIDLWGLWEKVKAIPTLVIRGAHSDLLLQSTALEMQARHPNLTLYEVEHAGHAPSLMEGKEIAFIHHWINANKGNT